MRRHLPGKHNQHSHGHGGGGRPTRGVDSDEGDDGDGMPATIVSQSLRFARGGNATITRPPGSRSRLTIGDRSVDLTTDREPGDPPTDLEDLRALIAASQYPGEDPRADGVRRLRTEEGSISIRPVVDGQWVTDTGRVVDSPDDAPENETYPAEYDVVVNEAGDSFDDNPSTRLSLTELEDDVPGGLESVGRAQRVETGFGPVDVYSPGRGRMGVRVLTDDGPLEVEFDAKDWKALWTAMGDSLEHGDSRTADTAHGPIEVQTDRDFDDIIFGRNSEMFVAPTSGEWSVAARGEGLRNLFSAMSSNGSAAGIERAIQSPHPVPLIRPRLRRTRGEPDVQQPLIARTYTLDDITIVSRGKGGDGRTVEAYAAVFDTPAEIHDHMGHYVERIDRRAFNRQLGLIRDNLGKVKVHYNHGFTLHGTPSELGSVPIGLPLEIRADSRGLRTVTRYNKSDLADAVLESIRNGEITGQSFRGQIYKSNPDRPPKARRGGDLPTVTRLELGLIEYGPTPSPAYESAGILAVRSAEAFLASLGDRRDQFLEDLLRAATSTDTTVSQAAPSATPNPGPGAADQPDGHSERNQRRLRLKAAAEFLGVST